LVIGAGPSGNPAKHANPQIGAFYKIIMYPSIVRDLKKSGRKTEKYKMNRIYFFIGKLIPSKHCIFCANGLTGH
jgi:hypothetical protein